MKLLFFSILIFTVSSFADTYKSHYGRSDTPYDQIKIPSSTFIVADTGYYNDVFLYRDDNADYEFTFELKINRFIGDDANIQKLIANNLISSKATIYLPVFDIDNEEPTVDCDEDGKPDLLQREVDEVYFNGEKVGVLYGSSDHWELNKFEVDIEKVKFPQKLGEVAINTVHVKVDVANQGLVLSAGQVVNCKQWGTEIDYVALDYEVVDPVMFVSGLFGDDGSFTESGYQEALREKGILSKILTHETLDRQFGECEDKATNSHQTHGDEFISQIKDFARLYNLSKFNLIAHSKGGLDSRYIINRLNSDDEIMVKTSFMDSFDVSNSLRISSIVTHGTPHKGTVLASAIMHGDVVQYLDELSTWSANDICDLSQEKARHFTSLNLVENIPFMSIGANADSNGDGELDEDELKYNQTQYGIIDEVELWAGNWLHKKIKYTEKYEEKKITLIAHSSGGASSYSFVINRYFPIAVASGQEKRNDTMVSMQSALTADSTRDLESFGNHKTVLFSKGIYGPHSGVQDEVINQGLNGILHWGIDNENY